MYQPNQAPYNPYQNPYNPQNPNDPNPYNSPNQFNNNPYEPASAFARGAIGNPARESNKLQEGQYYNGGEGSGLEENARTGFIRKVYTLVTIQLLITAAIGYIGYNNEGFRKTFGSTAAVIIISVLLIVVTLVIACCTQVFRRCALPLFLIFTVLMSILVAISISIYKSESVLMAVAITSVLVVGLTIYAWCTKTDFTGAGPYLFMFLLVLMCFGVALFFWKNAIAQLVYSCLGALLFCIYIIFDTQLIIGSGKYKYTLDDAYLAAINLYLDIINLFLHLLRIIGSR